jgi:hypothetical protein
MGVTDWLFLAARKHQYSLSVMSISIVSVLVSIGIVSVSDEPNMIANKHCRYNHGLHSSCEPWRADPGQGDCERNELGCLPHMGCRSTPPLVWQGR